MTQEPSFGCSRCIWTPKSGLLFRTLQDTFRMNARYSFFKYLHSYINKTDDSVHFLNLIKVIKCAAIYTDISGIGIFAIDPMRTSIVYIWLITIILPTFSQWGTIAYYQINKEYITKVLCKNRDKPQLHCNGHCFLARKLKAQEEKLDQQTREQVQNMPTLQLFAYPLAFFEFVASRLQQRLPLTFNYRLASYQAPLSILVPPPCL